MDGPDFVIQSGRVWDAWASSEGQDARLEVRTSTRVGDGARFADLLDGAVVDTNVEQRAQHWRGSGPPGGSPSIPTGEGAWFTLTVDAEEDLRSWTEGLARRLVGLGIRGTLTAAVSDAPLERVTHDQRGLVAVVSLRDWDRATGNRAQWTQGAWVSDPAAAARLVDLAMAWTGALDATPLIGSDAHFTAVDDSDRAAGLLRDVMSTPWVHAEVRRVDGTSEVRRVVFDHVGRMIFEIRSDVRPWHDVVLEHEALLSRLARRADYGFVRQALPFQTSIETVMNGVEPRLPRPPNGPANPSVWRNGVDLDGSQVPDAHGIQLLGEEHLRKAPDLPDWRVREVAPGRFIVAATDLTPWFADRSVDAEMVERARAQFANVIYVAPH